MISTTQGVISWRSIALVWSFTANAFLWRKGKTQFILEFHKVNDTFVPVTLGIFEQLSVTIVSILLLVKMSCFVGLLCFALKK